MAEPAVRSLKRSSPSLGDRAAIEKRLRPPQYVGLLSVDLETGIVYADHIKGD